MRRFFSFLAGILTGALVGGLAALLFAPMPGSDLRTEARTRFDDVLVDIRTAVAEERQRLEAELEALKRGEIKIA